MEATSTLWKLLWDYDPNGLLVLDDQMNIQLVNRALCRMLKSDPLPFANGGRCLDRY